MKYSEVGFREFLYQFCVLPLTEETKGIIGTLPGSEDANAMLTYGYYDREAGFTLDVIAAAKIEGEKISFKEASSSTRAMVRIGSVMDVDCYIMPDEDGELREQYMDRLEIISEYRASEEVEISREFSFLDQCRHQYYVDDVQVLLLKNGMQPEGCWVRISGLEKDRIIGILLNDPYQDFGLKAGDKIGFHAHKTEEEDTIICLAKVE